MKAHFEGHTGTLKPSSNNVIFYGIQFDSICTAIPFLKQFNPTDKIFVWYYRDLKGIKTSSEMVYVCNIWFTNDHEAEYYVDKLYNGRSNNKKNHNYAETNAW